MQTPIGKHATSIVVWGLSAAALVACDQTLISLETPQGYAVHALGRPAAIDARVSVVWPVAHASGLILNAEICDGQAYLFAPGIKAVHVADLQTGLVTRRIGRGGNGPGDLRRPVSIGIDCHERKLYIAEGPGGVLMFDTASGHYLGAVSTPFEFKASMGARIFPASERKRLMIPGLWPSIQGRPTYRTSGTMFRETRLGCSVSLLDEVSTPLTSTLSDGCDADPTACFRVDVAPLDPTWDTWVVGQGGSTQVAIVSSSSGRLRTIDIRSDKFSRDSSTPGSRAEDQVRWGSMNSTVWGVHVVDGLIAVVHAKHSAGDWSPGVVVQFDVFVNVYSADGDRLVSDLRLPGLPAGVHDRHLLVVDYGAVGRRPNASSVDLVSVNLRRTSP